MDSEAVINDLKSFSFTFVSGQMDELKPAILSLFSANIASIKFSYNNIHVII